MLLDNGDQVFLWLGSRSSEVEVKLTYKAVQVIYSTNIVIQSNLLLTEIIVLGVHATFTSPTTSTTATVVSNPEIQRD